ncbi:MULTISPECIES: methyltransferase domain-containing protein, partial [unclassified Micromonospora]|uniref:methyltransferase domain-containing protein n=1 Tax=unclassified Micromonospora TaxID=2617518 RepID=UPI003A875E11
MWDPAAYLRFTDHRSRPFADLLARVAVADPAVVVDLGCEPGTLAVHLADRWSGATVTGIDSSTEMVAAARALGSPVRFRCRATSTPRRIRATGNRRYLSRRVVGRVSQR